jgi:RimJ/RimL family protein N-acetyltransferase
MSVSSALTIETERLHMRPIETSDAYAAKSLLHAPKVLFWRKKLVPMRTIRAAIDTSRKLNTQGLGWWLIHSHKDKQDVIGDIFLQPLEGTGELEVGYHLLPDHWGKGFATEATSAMLSHGFDKLHLLRLNAIALPQNRPSMRVLERIGMRRKGPTQFHGLRYFCYQIGWQDYFKTAH